MCRARAPQQVAEHKRHVTGLFADVPRILVHEGLESLSKIAGPESDRLKMIANAGPKSRLACQAIMGTGDITIEVVNPRPQPMETN